MTHPDLRPLAIVGNLNVDLWVRSVDRLPDPGQETIVDTARLELAGTAGYVLLACRALGLPTLPVSSIGDDALGQFTLRTLADLGTTSSGILVFPGTETPISIVLVAPDGDRSILSTLGAHTLLDIDAVRAFDSAIAAYPDVFLCGTYLLPRLSPARIQPYAAELRRRGQTVFFDPSWDPGGWSLPIRNDTLVLLRDVDVFLPNETELLHLLDVSDLDAAIRTILTFVPEVIVKRGDRGALHATAGAWTEQPAFPVTPINTIGAGDIFDAGYIVARRFGWSIERRLQFAAALAALVVTQPGRRSYPDLSTILTALGTWTRDPAWETLGDIARSSEFQTG